MCAIFNLRHAELNTYLTFDGRNQLAENINEEMSILSMEQCQKLVLGSGIGTSNARFVLQTGEDFRDCDVLGITTMLIFLRAM